MGETTKAAQAVALQRLEPLLVDEFHGFRMMKLNIQHTIYAGHLGYITQVALEMRISVE